MQGKEKISWYQKILQLFFTNILTCVCCGREVFETEKFCESCLKKLPFNYGDCCQICGRPLQEEIEVCTVCQLQRPPFTMAKSNFLYRDEMVNLLYKFKNGHKYLANAFVPFADFFMHTDFAAVDCITYVPMYSQDEKKRGYNQAKVLAKAFAQRYALPLADNKIIKMKRTISQKKLNKADRLANLQDSFCILEEKYFQNKVVLLVDDILTTGATANCIAQLLQKCDVKKIFVYTIASVPK